uniref:SAPK8 n=1 Tax=Arundo donax TaxID=35708 RepID=A0A0A9F3V1_ARUDO
MVNYLTLDILIYLLAALDVLDGDKLHGAAVAHEARDAEVAGPDVAHELVAVAVVHDRHVHARPHRQRRPIRRRRCHVGRRRSTEARVVRVR